MEIVANFDEQGRLIKWCYNCKGFRPVESDGSGHRCCACGKRISYYNHLKEIPKVESNEQE